MFKWFKPFKSFPGVCNFFTGLSGLNEANRARP